MKLPIAGSAKRAIVSIMRLAPIFTFAISFSMDPVVSITIARLRSFEAVTFPMKYNKIVKCLM